MYKNGFLIGKFYPATLGHDYLITESAKQVERLTVIICALGEDKETFLSGQKRYEILKERYLGYKNIKIIFHNEDEPQYPEDHPRFWNIWLKIVLQYINPRTLDVLFSSEEYGNKFAELLGIKHVCVDLKREHVKISATDIREQGNFNWDFLPKESKRKLIKKVAIMGPESAGKSTMTKLLSEEFKCDYVEEYGRTFLEEKETLKGSSLTEYDFKEILVGHNKELEYKIFKVKNNLIVCDTEDVTTKVFYEMYFEKERALDLDLIPVESYDLRLVLFPDNIPTQDGTREFIEKEKRETHFYKIVDALNERNYLIKLSKGIMRRK